MRPCKAENEARESFSEILGIFRVCKDDHPGLDASQKDKDKYYHMNRLFSAYAMSEVVHAHTLHK